MEDNITPSRKRKIRLIAGLFTGLLLLFTFAGNTLQSLTMPKVLTITVSKGAMTHAYEESAEAIPVEIRALSNPAGWKVNHILVKKGDAVQKGQALIQYEGRDVQQQLADEKSALRKLELSMEQLQYNVMQAMQAEDEAARISAAAALESAKVDVSVQQKHIQNLQEQLADNQQITAPFDGIIMDVGALEGFSSTGKPDVVIANAAKGYKAELLMPSEVASLLAVGETLKDIKLADQEEHPPITGIVEKIGGAGGSTGSTINDSADSELNGLGGKAPSSMKQVEILLKDSSLHGGEQLRVNIAKSTNGDAILVPKEAIHKDQEGTYVFTLQEKEGPLGNAYYAVRTNVKVIDSNDTTSAVTEGLFDEQEVIVDSNDLIVDGTRVHK
ncbi:MULTISPECIES: efflux RND transporter periplasmic adaptor subunit [Paenibacillus]|uniref:Cation efflux system protein n=1 Tax=Paenibacillus albilobatus TaxID=2716884 RepID=A0A920CFA6_9BACL|nr:MULTISPECIES: biotin/lipoyl-binding protein [Paenibacillus]GIO34794.1 cation efflux system protein [Paenibacillus albilobatus]